MVYFVGAGPGDPDLITVKGQWLIEQADTIIYAGSLVNPEILQWARRNANIYDSSKMTLPEIISVMKKTEPGITVRLHTGDPSIYGAIREQMEELEKAGISYRVIPGVSSFSAAAAALKAEYTVPDGNQTLIITREAGRTSVPEEQALPALAGHGAAMAIFLSAGMTEQVQRHLIEGGYPEGTPAAIVYRASWPDEKIVNCTVGTLSESAAENGIQKQALLLVGDFLRAEDRRSKLYDPAFSTDVREGEKRGIAICAFTDKGETLAKRLAPRLSELLPAQSKEAFEKKAAAMDSDMESGDEMFSNLVTVTRIGQNEGKEPLAAWTRDNWYTKRALIFIGAAGIAVRAIAPYIKKKTIDPAVIVLDEEGNYIIPVLSGHIGGAVQLSKTIAGLTGGNAVITTASDKRGAFAIDTWAHNRGLVIINPEKIVDVTSSILEGRQVRLSSAIPLSGDLPAELDPGYAVRNADIVLSPYVTNSGNVLLLSPYISVGIGMKRGVTKRQIVLAMEDFCKEYGFLRGAIRNLFTIDLKKDEEGLNEFCREEGFGLVFYSADMLSRVPGEFTSSEFVKEVTGVDNVCERAAILGEGPGGTLAAKKTSYGGITLAAAIPEKMKF